jgi:hypothetical protein
MPPLRQAIKNYYALLILAVDFHSRRLLFSGRLGASSALLRLRDLPLHAFLAGVSRIRSNHHWVKINIEF